jgi:glutamine synthetase
MADYATLKRRTEEEAIEFVDFRVADLFGRLRHITIPAVRFTEDLVREGIGFDGSNYGYRHVEGSDMVLLPDLSTAYVEERGGETILSILSDICDAKTRRPAPIAPRGTAAAAVGVLRDRKIADDILVSPEFEFYVFDQVNFGSDPGRSVIDVAPIEGCDHRDVPGLGTPAHSAYHAPLPEDRLFGLRCEMARQIQAAGIEVKYHHHEVGTFGQQEIELGFAPLVRMADATLIVKSIVRNVADDSGMTATFLPKPMHGEAGNGMHLHQYLVRGGKNLFRGDGELTDLALCYVGGLLAHGRSLMALTNPSTNSYRRLVPGFEAPVHFAYGSGNRSAAVRVPSYAQGEKMRMELRTMDATCNPYFAFAAILLAGLDGIERKANAKDLGFGPVDRNLYDKGTGEKAPTSLGEALEALEADHDYLLAGGAFTEAGLEHWIRAKRQEVDAVAARPHPHEYVLYYDL